MLTKIRATQPDSLHIKELRARLSAIQRMRRSWHGLSYHSLQMLAKHLSVQVPQEGQEIIVRGEKASFVAVVLEGGCARSLPPAKSRLLRVSMRFRTTCLQQQPLLSCLDGVRRGLRSRFNFGHVFSQSAPFPPDVVIVCIQRRLVHACSNADPLADRLGAPQECRTFGGGRLCGSSLITWQPAFLFRLCALPLQRSVPRVPMIYDQARRRR